MNLALLLLLLSALRSTDRWPLYGLAAAALAVLSLEWQALSLLGLRVSVAWLGLLHATLLVILLWRARGRAHLADRLRSHAVSIARVLEVARPGSNRAVVVTALVVVLVVLTTRATLFLPEAADPYHLVKVRTLSAQGALAAVSSEDPKINVLGYLYELVLVDATLASESLQSWVGLQGPVLYLAYVLIVGWGIARGSGAAVPAFGLLLLCLVPAVFHQGILIKNDLFAALISIPALVLLHGFTRAVPPSTAWWIGLLAGLAASVKLTTMPLLLAAILFMPWQPVPLALRARMLVAGGFLAGILGGGLVYIALQNLAMYGAVAGPSAETGNTNTSLPAALESLVRFMLSWFDSGLLTRRLWPGRGGWGGAFGPAFVWALAVLVIRAGDSVMARRALGIVLCCLVPFGLVYPDADMAHRMAIAPGVFAILAAVASEAPRGTLAPRTPVALLAGLAVVASGALLARSSAVYLSQVEYLRSATYSQALAGDTTRRTEAWHLRQANAALAGATHVCTLMQENMMGLRGHSFEPMVETRRRGDRYVYEWRAGSIDRCDAVLVGPNSYPPPPPAVATWLERCVGKATVTGRDVSIRALVCRQAPR